MPQEILPPENASPKPDEATKRGLRDYTGPNADNRVLHVNLGIIKYGTDDQAHAAAIVLSFSLLAFIVALAIWGQPGEATEKLLGWLESAMLITVGVAIGQKGLKSSKSED